MAETSHPQVIGLDRGYPFPTPGSLGYSTGDTGRNPTQLDPPYVDGNGGRHCVSLWILRHLRY